MRISAYLIFGGLCLSWFLVQNPNAQASPFFSNGYFTPNGIEWCEENHALYEILGDKFFEHHNHSLESRICANLYQDYYWTYEGADRVEKLIERSKYYSQLEISESYEESMTGIIDTAPAENKDRTLIQGTIRDGEVIVQIISSIPKKNQTMEINLSFLDKYGKLIPDVKYGINMIQNGEIILENNDLYSEKGLSTLNTRALSSEEPMSIKVQVYSIGSEKVQENKTRLSEDVIEFTVVPEFGTITIILLGIAISMTVLTSAKINSSLAKLNP